MTTHYDWSPAQRSMLVDKTHYRTSAMSLPKLGVIMEVRHADNPKNRASMEQTDKRGWLPEATVWLMQDGAILQHVLIPPNSAIGLDNFEEQLPRASKLTVKGDSFDENISQVDPNDLDGDWCVIQFLDGSIQNPYIANWWPNPRNIYDCATSGYGNPVFTTSKGLALDQSGRYFRRINGVEYVVTKDGDIWISTARAGSQIKSGAASSDGRFPRSTFSDGGSILLNVKPSETLEISFDSQVDGIGPGQVPNDSLPQANPSSAAPTPPPLTQTYIKCGKDGIDIKMPVRFTVRSKTVVLIEAPDIHLGETSTDFAAMTTPTMENFTTLVARVNYITGLLNVGLLVSNATPAGPGPVITTPAAIIPLNPPTNVACTKVHIE